MTPVVVAENRPRPQRGGEAGEFAGPNVGRNALGDKPVVSDVIAEQHDEVGRKSIRIVDDAANMLDRHVWAAGMDIGDRGHPEAPSRRGEVVTSRSGSIAAA
jgi:hypothetical protein